MLIRYHTNSIYRGQTHAHAHQVCSRRLFLLSFYFPHLVCRAFLFIFLITLVNTTPRPFISFFWHRGNLSPSDDAPIARSHRRHSFVRLAEAALSGCGSVISAASGQWTTAPFSVNGCVANAGHIINVDTTAACKGMSACTFSMVSSKFLESSTVNFGISYNADAPATTNKAIVTITIKSCTFEYVGANGVSFPIYTGIYDESYAPLWFTRQGAPTAAQLPKTPPMVIEIANSKFDVSIPTRGAVADTKLSMGSAICFAMRAGTELPDAPATVFENSLLFIHDNSFSVDQNFTMGGNSAIYFAGLRTLNSSILIADNNYSSAVVFSLPSSTAAKFPTNENAFIDVMSMQDAAAVSSGTLVGAGSVFAVRRNRCSMRTDGLRETSGNGVQRKIIVAMLIFHRHLTVNGADKTFRGASIELSNNTVSFATRRYYYKRFSAGSDYMNVLKSDILGSLLFSEMLLMTGVGAAAPLAVGNGGLSMPNPRMLEDTPTATFITASASFGIPSSTNVSVQGNTVVNRLDVYIDGVQLSAVGPELTTSLMGVNTIANISNAGVVVSANSWDQRASFTYAPSPTMTNNGFDAVSFRSDVLIFSQFHPLTSNAFFVVKENVCPSLNVTVLNMAWSVPLTGMSVSFFTVSYSDPTAYASPDAVGVGVFIFVEENAMFANFNFSGAVYRAAYSRQTVMVSLGNEDVSRRRAYALVAVRNNVLVCVEDVPPAASATAITSTTNFITAVLQTPAIQNITIRGNVLRHAIVHTMGLDVFKRPMAFVGTALYFYSNSSVFLPLGSSPMFAASIMITNNFLDFLAGGAMPSLSSSISQLSKNPFAFSLVRIPAGLNSTLQPQQSSAILSNTVGLIANVSANVLLANIGYAFVNTAVIQGSAAAPSSTIDVVNGGSGAGGITKGLSHSQSLVFSRAKVFIGCAATAAVTAPIGGLSPAYSSPYDYGYIRSSAAAGGFPEPKVGITAAVEIGVGSAALRRLLSERRNYDMGGGVGGLFLAGLGRVIAAAASSQSLSYTAFSLSSPAAGTASAGFSQPPATTSYGCGNRVAVRAPMVQNTLDTGGGAGVAPISGPIEVLDNSTINIVGNTLESYATVRFVSTTPSGMDFALMRTAVVGAPRTYSASRFLIAYNNVTVGVVNPEMAAGNAAINAIVTTVSAATNPNGYLPLVNILEGSFPDSVLGGSTDALGQQIVKIIICANIFLFRPLVNRSGGSAPTIVAGLVARGVNTQLSNGSFVEFTRNRVYSGYGSVAPGLSGADYRGEALSGLRFISTVASPTVASASCHIVACNNSFENVAHEYSSDAPTDSFYFAGSGAIGYHTVESCAVVVTTTTTTAMTTTTTSTTTTTTTTTPTSTTTLMPTTTTTSTTTAATPALTTDRATIPSTSPSTTPTTTTTTPTTAPMTTTPTTTEAPTTPSSTATPTTTADAPETTSAPSTPPPTAKDPTASRSSSPSVSLPLIASSSFSLPTASKSLVIVRTMTAIGTPATAPISRSVSSSSSSSPLLLASSATVPPPPPPSEEEDTVATLAPIRASDAESTNKQTQEVVGVMTGAVGVLAGTTAGSLGVANAMGRLVACDDDDDDELPIMTHPLRFRFDDSVTGVVSAAVLSNCLLFPFVIVGAARYPIKYVVHTYMSQPGTTEAEVLASLGWPSLVVLPFVPLGEGIAVVVTRSLRYGEPLGIVMGLFGVATLAFVISAWVYTLQRRVPRGLLYHRPCGALSRGWRWWLRSLYEWEPLSSRAGDGVGGRPSKALLSAPVDARHDRSIHPRSVDEDEDAVLLLNSPHEHDDGRYGGDASDGANHLLLLGNSDGMPGVMVADRPPPSAADSNLGDSINFAGAASETDAAAAIVAERLNTLDDALLRSAHMIGEKRFYYAEFISFICSLIVGVAEGMPGSTCKVRVLIAFGAAVVQAASNATAIVPLELLLQSVLGLCVSLLAAIAVVQVFTKDSDGDGDDGSSIFSSSSLGDLMDVVNAVSNVVGLLATLYGIGRSAYDAYSATGRRANAQQRIATRRDQQQRGGGGGGGADADAAARAHMDVDGGDDTRVEDTHSFDDVDLLDVGLLVSSPISSGGGGAALLAGAYAAQPPPIHAVELIEDDLELVLGARGGGGRAEKKKDAEDDDDSLQMGPSAVIRLGSRFGRSHSFCVGGGGPENVSFADFSDSVLTGAGMADRLEEADRVRESRRLAGRDTTRRKHYKKTAKLLGDLTSLL